MITGALKQRVDRLWEEFWTGGITNPLTVIEQISFLAFARLIDIRESTEQKKWNRTHKGKPFPGVLFSPDEQELRWSQFHHLGGEEMLAVVRDRVFPHMKALGRTHEDDVTTFGRYMADAQCMIQKPSLMQSAVAMIGDLPLDRGDTKGDLYEYLLSKLTTAGISGQFRTPRHVIALMADLVEPQPEWTIADPACGTGGFLVGVMENLRRRYTSDEGRITEDVDGEQVSIDTGDLLEPYRAHVRSGMFHGFDFDVTMLRIAAMNLMLHGVDRPDVHYQDTLSNSFPEKFPACAENAFDLVLANPPFKGSLDHADVHPSLTAMVKTRKTELLFVALILKMLKLGGRAAVIVPDGVLFGSSRAHKALRKLLVEDNQLEAVVKLPAGVFKPYAGVSTAILLFTKGGRTTDVWYFNVEADGLSLDDKRDPVEENDLPACRTRWTNRNPKTDNDRTAKYFHVPRTEIKENDYDLSLNRYQEIIYEEPDYDPPKEIIARLKTLEAEIVQDLEELEEMLG